MARFGVGRGDGLSAAGAGATDSSHVDRDGQLHPTGGAVKLNDVGAHAAEAKRIGNGERGDGTRRGEANAESSGKLIILKEERSSMAGPVLNQVLDGTMAQMLGKRCDFFKNL